MTGLPIIETKANDVSAFIPTNVISITDGQVFLESDLFGCPPCDQCRHLGVRVGGAAQTKGLMKVSGSLRLELAQFRELEAFAAFASDLDDASKAQLERGARWVEMLKQDQYSPYPSRTRSSRSTCGEGPRRFGAGQRRPVLRVAASRSPAPQRHRRLRVDRGWPGAFPRIRPRLSSPR